MTAQTIIERDVIETPTTYEFLATKYAQAIIERGVTEAPTTYEFLAAKYGTATLTPEQLAVEYHSHPTRVRHLCAEGHIEAVKVGGKRWAIPIAAAAAFLDGEAK